MKNNNMKQIFKEQYLIGKTIDKVLMPKNAYEELWLKFTDNSFAVFDTEDRTVGYANEEKTIVLSDNEVDNTDKNLVELGLITQDQLKAARKEAKERSEKRFEAELQEDEARLKEFRRQHYEALKKEFE